MAKISNIGQYKPIDYLSAKKMFPTEFNQKQQKGADLDKNVLADNKFKVIQKSNFTKQDENDLHKFVCKISDPKYANSTHVNNQINNFSKKSYNDLASLFNLMSNSSNYKDLQMKLPRDPSGNILMTQRQSTALPYLFSIVKHYQEPDKYPLMYVFWMNLCDVFFSTASGTFKDYDQLCDVYNNKVAIHDKPKHSYFSAYMDALARDLAQNIGPNIINYTKGAIEDVFNIDDYDTLLGYKYRRNKNKTGNVQSSNPTQTPKPNPSSAPAKESGESKKTNEPRHPLNLILYGPPGTGKTYNTVNEALDIIEPKWREKDEYKNADGDEAKRNVALDLFNDYKEKGQIVFTTFHQSLSYEEFIEGIKPINGDTSIVIKHNNANTTGTNQFGEGFSTIDDLSMMRYDVKPGIFKDICLKAAQNFQSNFDECYEEFIKDIAEEKYFELQTIKQSEFYVSVNRNNNLKLYTTENKNLNGVLTKENIYATHLGKLDYWKGYMQGVLNYLKDKYNLKDSQNEKTLPYVLIIDEINRGNVSQIFGELITLIEEDKRTTKWDKDKKQYVDNPEKITVKLPYSPDEEPFGVPGNLYIIGTMNTADRSVEALDTALRRRFEFKEMMPNSKIKDKNGRMLFYDREICGVKLGELMDTINSRIRVLKDREHQIGHSYFMKCKTEEDLKNVFKNNIVPLLQEYFYGNYAYIGLVLGNEFVKKEDAKPKFASLDGYTYDSDNEPTYRLLTDDEWEELKMNNALDNLKVNKSDTSENVTENEQLS